MEWLTSLGIPQQYTGLATLIFVAVVAGGAGVARVIGKREGPPAPKVQEFYASGQLADMGPVKELIEQLGLLVQQQIRANIFTEQAASALAKLATAIEARMAEERNEAEIEAEVQRRLDRQLRERRARARRKPAT